MKKLCIFDLDGTLNDTITAISHFGNTALYEALGKEPIDKEEYKKFAGDGRDVLIHRMLDFYGLDNEENFIKTRKIYDFHYESNPLYKTDAFDGIKELILDLKNNGVKIAVCSNKPDNVVQDVIKNVFGDVFDAVCGAREGYKTKPDPVLTMEIISNIGADKQETYFIGDTNIDIFTAKNAGVKAIGVLWGFRDEAELRDAGADYIVSNPSEIYNIVKETKI